MRTITAGSSARTAGSRAPRRAVGAARPDTTRHHAATGHQAMTRQGAAPKQPVTTRQSAGIRQSAERRRSAGQAPLLRLVPTGAAVAGSPGKGVRARARLTRRGRILVVTLVVAAMLMVAALAWLAGTARAQASLHGAPPGAVYRNLTQVVVHPGQTLWSIASQTQPTADPRSVVQEIITLNDLRSVVIEPGQRLWIPRT